jgi:hypothetical protein
MIVGDRKRDIMSVYSKQSVYLLSDKDGVGAAAEMENITIIQFRILVCLKLIPSV